MACPVASQRTAPKSLSAAISVVLDAVCGGDGDTDGSVVGRFVVAAVGLAEVGSSVARETGSGEQAASILTSRSAAIDRVFTPPVWPIQRGGLRPSLRRRLFREPCWSGREMRCATALGSQHGLWSKYDYDKDYDASRSRARGCTRRFERGK